MSARSVWSGSGRADTTRTRAFRRRQAARHANLDALARRSAAPSRRALRIARRNATRLSSCSATDSATSCASSSGFWTSWMLMKTSRSVRFWRSSFSFSTSAPFRPMMMPGREVWMLTFRLAARSISIFARRRARTFFRYLRSAGLRAGARVVLVREPARMPGRGEPSRKPIGLTFCPKGLPE